MKKIITLILTFIFMLGVFGAFVGCTPQEDDGKISIVTTIFPEYDWVKNILGDQIENIELTLLLDNGVDMHNFQPTVEDIAILNACDLFIYVGGESDSWVESALSSSNNKNMKVLRLFDVLKDVLKEEEHDHEHEEEHDHEHEEDHDHDHEHIYDEHVWLSILNAKIVCKAIQQKITELDEAHSGIYKANLDEYLQKLNSLDYSYEKVVSKATHKAFVFGDRFPFRYLAEDYGIEYHAAFSGCSAETEASFETIVRLAQKVDELGLGFVMTTEASDAKIAQTIIQNTKDKNQKVLAMDSMQSISLSDIKNGTTYLSVMRKNLDVLETALN